MPTETLTISAFDVNSGVTWNNTGNAIGDTGDDTDWADSSDIADLQYGGFNMSNTTHTPDTSSTDLVSCLIHHSDLNSELSDDTMYLEVYNPDTTSWETLVTYSGSMPSGNPDTVSATDVTTSMRTKYGAASDKAGFLDGLQFRLRCAKSKAADNVNWAVAYATVVYNWSYQTYQELNLDVVATGVVSTDVDSFQTDELNLTVQATAVASCDYDFIPTQNSAYIDCADADNAGHESQSPASNIFGEDAECSTEGPQQLTLYDDGSTLNWGLCYEIVGGSAPSVLEGLGTEQNAGVGIPVYPPSGDAALYFGRLINFASITYVDTGANSSVIEIRFSVLDPTKTYTITVCGMRNGSGVSYDRWTRYTLTVGDNWTEEHSTGTIKGGTPNGEFCTYRAGKNYTEGYVARWSGIQPDSGGNITIKMEGVAEGGDAADKAYLTALIITESSLVTYQELNLTVQATGIVSCTDTHETSELDRTAQATGVVSCTDDLIALESNRTVQATGAVSCTETVTNLETNRTVSATGVVSCTDSHVLQVELNKTVSADAIVSCDDDLLGTVKELNLLVQADGVVSTEVDSHYWQVEENRTVQATGVVSCTDIVIIDEISDNNVLNGNFDNWTSGDPDNWGVNEGPGSVVSEVGNGQGSGGGGSGACNLYSTGLFVQIAQTVPIVSGKTYCICLLVDTIITNGVRMWDDDATPEFSIQDYTTTGYKTIMITASGDHIDFIFDGANLSACDVTIDNIEVEPVIYAEAVVSCIDEHFLGEYNKIVQADGVISCTDNFIALESNKTVSAIGVVSCTDDYIQGELNRTVAFIGEVSCIDSLVVEELNKIVSATGVVSCTDILVQGELDRTVSAIGVVSCTDNLIAEELNRTVTATGVVSCTDSHVLQIELNKTVSATGVVSCTDDLLGVVAELNLTVQADGVVSCTDSHYWQVEENRTVSATGVVSCTDNLIAKELNKTVQADGIVSCIDLSVGEELNRTVQADGIVSCTETVNNLETNRTVQADGIVSCIDSHEMVELNKTVSATGAVVCTDLAINFDSVLVQADGVVSCTDLSVGAVAVATWFILRQCSV